MAGECQSLEAASFAAEAYEGRLRLLDALAGETGGSFLTGADVTIVDCNTFATVQFAQDVYGVANPDGCPRAPCILHRLVGPPGRDAARLPNACSRTCAGPFCHLSGVIPQLTRKGSRFRRVPLRRRIGERLAV